jgi:P27 family predicted phage terminase small subunit
MGRRGVRPEPTALKVMRGNPGRRPLNHDEPQPEIAAPTPPDILDELAVAEWHRVIGDLVANRLMTALDRAALANYCQAWSNWVQAEGKVRELGAVMVSSHGIPCPSPWASRANQERIAIRQFLAEFGMSPAARSGVRMSPSEPKDRLAEHQRKLPKGPTAATA